MPDKIGLTSGVSSIRGVGQKKKQVLETMGIRSVRDLLEYYPYKYRDRRNVYPATKAPDDRDVLVEGVLVRMNTRSISGWRTMVECTLKDSSGVFNVVFFNMPYIRNSLKTGERYAVFGRMKLRRGARVWTNPEMSPAGGERDLRGIIPVYRCVSGISSPALAKLMREALDTADINREWMDESLVEKRKLCSPAFAFCNIHFPESDRHYKAARYRIIYEQLLIYQIALRMRRRNLEAGAADASIPDIPLAPFIDSLPFSLTAGQEECVRDIEKDLTDKRPMNRLIQGDVGCGKTVVAECAIYKCVKAGMQAAMMAPTEILARQHFDRLSKDLGRHGINCVLLTSGMKAAERREALAAVSEGRAGVVIGTHALIQKDVEFRELALVITDEQHRFGVEQRKTLTRKGRAVNVCVMSATPIPRTMAATVFGDMDFSIIRSRPKDRKAVITRVLDESSRERAYAAVRDEVAKGNLAYIVAPSIDSEDGDMSSVTKLYSEVSRRFSGCSIGLLHGRMSGEEKDAVMADFSAGRYEILVSTVVIEVGIDVPGATIIVIENSERFGLAQMHQLRGRVGRNDKQSYCYLINYSKSEQAEARARAMAEISDGFEISEADYELRGPGDITGTMQSGRYDQNIITLCRYTDILEAAIEDAEEVMRDPRGTDISYAYGRMAAADERDNSNVL